MRKFSTRSLYYTVAVALLLVLPLLGFSSYETHILVMCLINYVLCASYTLTLGYTGMFNLAHITFYAIGGYTSALLSVHLRTPFLINLIVAGVTALIIAFLLGVITLKRAGVSFGIVTFAFHIVMWVIDLNLPITRGALGISRIPRPYILGSLISSPTLYYYLYITIALITLLILYLIINSRVGRALIAIREDELLASVQGVNCYRYKMFAFLVSSFFAGIAGSMYVQYSTYIGPEVFNMYYIIVSLTITIVGGGRLEGVLISSFAFTAIPEFLRIAQILRESIYGLILIVAVLASSLNMEKFKNAIRLIFYGEKHGASNM